MKTIRWLGAFRKGASSLSESLKFELNRDFKEEVAAETIFDGEGSKINNSRVGLLLKKKSVRIHFNGDVWSLYSGDGNLYKTRKPYGMHKEAFCNPDYAAIVVKNGFLSKKIMKTVQYWAQKKGLPILFLTKKGELKKIKM